MQRTTESTIITYAKVTINNGNVEAVTASEKVPEKDPDKAIKIFRKSNQTDSIIKTEAIAETTYMTDYVWSLFATPDKVNASILERVMRECKDEVFAVISREINKVVEQVKAGE